MTHISAERSNKKYNRKEHFAQKRAERKARMKAVNEYGTGAYEPKGYQKEARHPAVLPLDMTPTMKALLSIGCPLRRK